MNEHHNSIIETVCVLLDEKSLKYIRHPKKRSISIAMVGDYMLKRCTLRLSHRDSLLQLYISSAIFIKPEKMRSAATEFITRANYGLAVGCFEMDLRDGEIRYHASHIIQHGEITKEVLEVFLSSGIHTSERYFNALMQMVFGGLTPADAIYIAELDRAVAKLDGPNPQSPPQTNSDDTEAKS